ncbi:MAG: exodeoxyribonuclease VII large subunit [Bdellovibrio sp.]
MSYSVLDKELNVRELVFLIKNQLEGDFLNVTVKGEISNFSASQAGHYYFNISDEEASLSCAVFRADALRNPELRKIKNGDNVTCFGSISVYVKKGQFQLVVRRIDPLGKGSLLEQFERLKRKLEAEGLFSDEHKKKIPQLPKRVAVITAEGGAALQDFLNIYRRRSVLMDVLLVPAIVQGKDSAESLIRALQKCIEFHLKASEDKKIDVIVITRGGGSSEDLWSFNDEALAYEIFNCPIPVISAVGHQVDFTICDFVADLRTETPSAAAELLTAFQTRIVSDLNQKSKRLRLSMNNIIKDNRALVSHGNPVASIQKIISGIFNLRARFLNVKFINRERQLLGIDEHHQYLDDLIGRLLRSISDFLKTTSNNLDRQHELLNSLNPKNILTRGYSYVTDAQGNCVSRQQEFANLRDNAELTLHFSDGDGKVIKRGL